MNHSFCSAVGLSCCPAPQLCPFLCDTGITMLRASIRPQTMGAAYLPLQTKRANRIAKHEYCEYLAVEWSYVMVAAHSSGENQTRATKRFHVDDKHVHVDPEHFVRTSTAVTAGGFIEIVHNLVQFHSLVLPMK